MFSNTVLKNQFLIKILQNISQLFFLKKKKYIFKNSNVKNNFVNLFSMKL